MSARRTITAGTSPTPSPPQALKNIPGITVVEEENVPETDAVAKTMESMIKLDGATLIFPTSFGYFDPFMLEAAKKYPERRVPPSDRPVEQGQASDQCRRLYSATWTRAIT